MRYDPGTPAVAGAGTCGETGSGLVFFPEEYVMAIDLKFAKTHEWVRPESDGVATVGISSYAVEALTDLVFMQLPAVGKRVKAGESFGEIESVKAVSDLYAPVSGEVVEVNTALPGKLETLGQDPYGAGWVVRIKADNPAELDNLLDQGAYEALVRSQPH
jgi:glycine cleavage system H protein